MPEALTEGERRREKLIYRAYRGGELLLSALPRRFLLAAAAAAGNAAYDLSPHKRRTVLRNVSHAMRLPADAPRVRRAARGAFRNYAKYVVDMMRLGSLTDADVERLVHIENIDILDEARAIGRGVLVCAVHVGGMDFIGPALLRSGEKMHVVADDTTYGRLYEHLKAQRARHGLHLIGWRNLRALFRVLRDGGSLVLFCDGGYRRGDVPVEFMGEATTFPIGPASLSARAGAAILPVGGGRTATDTFEARGLPLITVAGNEPGELYRATQALADALGSVISADPAQWYMFRPVWPETDAEREEARAALATARRGEDWNAR